MKTNKTPKTNSNSNGLNIRGDTDGAAFESGGAPYKWITYETL